MKTVTLDITIGNDTRPVEFRMYTEASEFAHSGAEFAAHFASGNKTHAVSATVVRLDDDTSQKVAACYPASQRYIDAEGTIWGMQGTAVVLNRHATITGWFVSNSAYNSQHIGARRQ